LLKSKEMLACNAEASVNGSLVGTAFIFVGYCVGTFIASYMFPMDTKIDAIEKSSDDRIQKLITTQKLIKNPTLKESLREGCKEAGIGGAGVLLGGLLAGIVMCGIGAAIDAIFGMEGIADLLI
jgi:hypothetical protein